MTFHPGLAFLFKACSNFVTRRPSRRGTKRRPGYPRERLPIALGTFERRALPRRDHLS